MVRRIVPDGLGFSFWLRVVRDRYLLRVCRHRQSQAVDPFSWSCIGYLPANAMRV